MVLGAYPSALHVEWCPPPPFKRIAAHPGSVTQLRLRFV
jgi:hypothetical protein